MGDLRELDYGERRRCRRCSDGISSGDEYARGAFGYEYLCADCAEELGVHG